jgi:hypothetical protein
MRIPAAACAAVVALACLAPVAAAAEFSATTTTIVRGFDLIHREIPGVERVRKFRPIDQLVRASYADFGHRSAWTLDGQVRFRLDAATGRYGGSLDPATGAPRWEKDEDLDVLVAKAGWKSKEGLLELGIGRQQAITGFGWHAYDGVRLDFPKLDHFRVFTLAGLPVELGRLGSPQTDGFTWAAGVTGVFPRHGSLGVDYELRRRDGSTTDETLGVDLGLRFGDTTLEANADYSLLLATFGETSASVRHVAGRRHDFEARFTRIAPIFSVTDDAIWLVFDVNPYDEWRASYEHRGARGLDVGGYISTEKYDDDHLEQEEEPGEPPHVHPETPSTIDRGAVTLRWQGSREAAHRSEIGWQDGWTGSRLALRHDSDWSAGPHLRVGAGASFQRYENLFRLTEQDEAWSVRARVRHDHGRWDLGMELEQLFGRDRDTLRATAVFATRWGAARAVRQWWQPWWGGRFRDSVPRGLGNAPLPRAEAPAADDADGADDGNDSNGANDAAGANGANGEVAR